MIQRIQTVWLFLASLALFSLFLFPYIHAINPIGASQAIKVTGVYTNINGFATKTESFTAITVATIILGLLPLAIISQFKSRKRQLSLSYITILLVLAFSFWLVKTAKNVIGNVDLDFNNYGLGVIMPSLVILFIILAIKGIRKDENLIKSADRLR